MFNASVTKLALTAVASAMLLGAVQAEAGQRAKRVQFQAATAQTMTAQAVTAQAMTTVQARQLQLKQAPAQRLNKLRQNRQGGGGQPTVGGFAGNGNALANLIVVPYYNNGGLPEGMPGESFCSNTPGGGSSDKIRFWIKNVGNSSAPSFQWNLYLWESGDAPGNVVGSIPAGGKKLITQGIPGDCYTSPYHGQCPFKIELDYHNEVSESNEGDNEVSSHCLSPAS